MNSIRGNTCATKIKIFSSPALSRSMRRTDSSTVCFEIAVEQNFVELSPPPIFGRFPILFFQMIALIETYQPNPSHVSVPLAGKY